MLEQLNKEYWTKRYTENETGWDVGEVTTPLKMYFDQLVDKELRILIPGAGNAYEAEYLVNAGFKNVTVVDISEEPLKNIKTRNLIFPSEQLICQDFFEHEQEYDLIIEQTFFCALHPLLRKEYAKKMHELLVPNGKLVGLLFNVPLNETHPPFGGNAEEYKTYFSELFNFNVFEPCYNSIKPRADRELFICLEKK